MTDTASTQLLPTYISSLAERLNNLEALLADRTHRHIREVLGPQLLDLGFRFERCDHRLSPPVDLQNLE